MTDTTQTPSQAVAVAPTATPAVRAGQIARREFGGDQLEQSAETAGSALAAQARAMVEARFVVAMRRPRDIDDVRAKLLRACERPGFAGSATEKTWGAAWYRKPVGDGVEGFSIRFAEEAMRCMTNIDTKSITVYEDHEKRVVNVTVIDLESNVGHEATLVVTKTTEKRSLPRGMTALLVRTNSKGEPTYVVPATDDETLSKQANLTSKAIRTLVLRHVPGDIQAECRKRILAIRNGEAAKDPDALRKKVSDGFAALNILPSQVKDYLKHDLAQATPAELTHLREIWEAISEGTLTWAQVMEANTAEDVPVEDAAAAPKKAPIVELTERLKAQGSAPAAPAPAAPSHPADDPNAEREPETPVPADTPKGSGAFGKAVEKEAQRRGGPQRSLVEE